MDESAFNVKAQLIGSIQKRFQSAIGTDLTFIAERNWPQFLQGLADLDRFLTPAEFRDAGRHFLADCPPLCSLIKADKISSPSNQTINLFGAHGLLAIATPIQTSAIQKSTHRILVTAKFNNGMPPCRPFFDVLAGLLEQLASLMDYPAARVEADIDSHGASYLVTIPSRSALKEIKAKIGRLLTPEHTAEMLQTLSEEHWQLIAHQFEPAIAPATNTEPESSTQQLNDSFIDGIVKVDAGLKVAHVNSAFCLITGHTRESLIGKPIRKIVPDLPGVGSENGYTNIKALCGDKTLRPLSAFRSDVDSDGHVTYIIRDLTKETQAAWKQSQLSTQLREAQKMDSMGQLSSGIVHDFNNLLFAIQANAELAITDSSLSQQALRDIAKATERGIGITSRLLHYSRPTTNAKSSIDLNPVVRDAAHMIQAIVPENVVIETSLPTEPTLVDAAEHQIEQILVNLMVNARDAMPSGGSCLIRVQTIDETIKMTVSDTGTGIDKATQNRIFEPMFTTKTRGKGTGLGLSIVVDIVKSLGGSINIESTPGTGSSFSIWLPLAKTILNESVREKAQPKSVGTQSSTQDILTGTILVVEDNEQVLALTTLMLKGAGFDVITATNGEDAILQLTASEPIDLVLLDVVLPVLGGRETYRRIIKLYPNTPVLFTSAYPGNSPQLDFINEQSLPFIAKPFGTDAIRDRVSDLLNKTRNSTSQSRQLDAS